MVYFEELVISDNKGDLGCTDFLVNLFQNLDLIDLILTYPNADLIYSSVRPSRYIFLATKYFAYLPSLPSLSFTL